MSTTLQPLPNPFLNSQAAPRAGRPSRFAVQPALAAFLVCLVLGLAAAGWRAKARVDEARARAGLEALARGAAMELQFSQVMSAAEVLGVLAKQHGGAIPDFQKVAGDLIAARPGLASLELQPGGIVSDVAPRAANARAIGFNVLNHPAYRPGALAAIQRRTLTVTGPLGLYNGEPGIVARVPVFLRGRDGRDAFWGFVAASMRVSEAMYRAQVDDLGRQGYSYALAAPAAGREKSLSIVASHGAVSVQGAAQQTVRAQDAVFRLLVQPRGGWISKPKLTLDILAVLAASGLICLLVNLLESRRAVEAALSDANQRFARETEDRKQAQAEHHSARNEAAAAQAELSRTRSALQTSNESEVRLSVAIRTAEAAAQAAQSEVEQARMARQQAEQTIASLQSRLRAVSRAENKIQAIPLPPPPDEQPPIPDTPNAVDASTPPAEPGAETGPAGVAVMEVTYLESSTPPEVSEATPAAATSPEPESPAPLTPPEPPPAAEVLAPEPPAEQKPARTPRRRRASREDQLDTTTPPAEPGVEPSPASVAVMEVTYLEPSTPPEVSEAAPSIPEPATETAPVAATSAELESSAPSVPPEPPPTAEVLAPEPPAEQKPARAPRRKRAPRNLQLDTTTPPAELSVEPSPDSITQVEEPHQELSTPPAESEAAPSTTPGAVPASTTSAEPESSAAATPPEPPPSAEVPPPEPPAEQKPARTPRRKKVVRDNQLDFFAAPPAAEPASATPAVRPPAEAPPDGEPALPPSDEFTPSAASAESAPEQPAVEASDHPPTDAKPKEAKPARPLPARPPLDIAQLRKAVNLILPLFTGRDPGARDCLKDNRTTFRSAFAPEVYVEFEDSVKSGDFDTALEHLKKAARKHGIPT